MIIHAEVQNPNNGQRYAHAAIMEMLEAVCKSKSTWRDLGPVTWATFSPCCTGFFIRFFNEYGGFSIIKGTEGNCNP